MKSKKANKSNSSVRFLGESTARQSAFRFYLTLVALCTMEVCKKEGMPLENTYICMKIRHIIHKLFHPIVGGGVEEVLALWFSNWRHNKPVFASNRITTLVSSRQIFHRLFQTWGNFSIKKHFKRQGPLKFHDFTEGCFLSEISMRLKKKVQNTILSQKFEFPDHKSKQRIWIYSSG